MTLVPGVDISHHNEHVSWPRLAGYVPWSIVRAGDDLAGAQPSDREFARNVEQAQAHGVPLGVYQFVRDNRDAGTQAARFARVVRDACAGAPVERVFPLGVWADLEAEPNTPAAYGHWVRDYLAALDDELGVVAGVYTRAQYWRRWLPGVTDQGHRPLWLARYPRGDTPPPEDPGQWASWVEAFGPALPHGWSSWDIWQFSSSGNGVLAGTTRAHALDCDLMTEQFFTRATGDGMTPEQDAMLRRVHDLLYGQVDGVDGVWWQAAYLRAELLPAPVKLGQIVKDAVEAALAARFPQDDGK